jgi:hypothetical protein
VSVTPDAMTALLAQYGLMGPSAQPNPQGGLMGAINAAMAPYGGAAQAGLAMMGNTSGATNPMAALSQGLLNSQQLSLTNQNKQLQNAGLAQGLLMNQIQMPYLRARAQAIQAALNGGGGQSGAPQGTQTTQGAGSVPSNPYAPVTQDQIAGTTVPNVMPPMSQFLMGGPNANLGQIQEQYRDKQIEVQKQQHAAAVARLDNLIASDHPAQYAATDQGFQSLWPSLAQQMGVDPVNGYTDSNARRALGMVRNPLAASVGMTTEPVPEAPQLTAGSYGSVYATSQGGKTPGAVSEIVGQKPPTLTAEKVYDLNTGKYEDRLVQTSVGGVTPPIPGLRGGAGRPPAVQGGAAAPTSAAPGLGNTAATVDLGAPAPTPENNKAAMFAGEMRAGLQTMQKMEGTGFRLGTGARTIAINMATDESPGLMGQYLSQQVAAHALSPQEQAYLASMMPLLQAAGHDQSGARLTTAQIRQNVESLLPLGSSQESLTQVQKNRQGFYEGLLTQAGQAVKLPQYRNSLLPDLQRAQGLRKTVNGKDYVSPNADKRWFLAGPTQ